MVIKPLCYFVILDEMQNYRQNLGTLCSVHYPSKPSIWVMLMLSIPMLIIVTLCTLLILDSFTGIISGSKEVTSDGVSKYFICMGVVSLLLAVMVSISVSDYRAWSSTKSVKLTIYQEGFTYESEERIEICRWDEIEKIRYKSDQVTSKALRFRMVKVIRAIVKKDGAVIKLAETLDLRQITDLIIAAKKAGL